VSQSDPTTTPSTDPTTDVPAAQPPASAPTGAKKATAKKTAATKATAKKTGAKKATAKKTTAKKASAKKTGEPETPPAAPARSPEQIQADIDAAQQRLADTVDALSDRLSPASLADDAISSVKGVFVDQDGRIKPKPLAIIGGTVVGLVVLRALFHRD
jgi:hypothetical protein